MGKKTIIGIMGPGSGATDADFNTAEETGKIVAGYGFKLLTGGRPSGVMEAAMIGAKNAGGTTIGILPGSNPEEASEYTDIPIATGMGSGRNNINVLSSDLVIAIGLGPGTLSEIALAIKAGKPLILLNQTAVSRKMLDQFKYDHLYYATDTESLPNLFDQLLL